MYYIFHEITKQWYHPIGTLCGGGQKSLLRLWRGSSSTIRSCIKMGVYSDEVGVLSRSDLLPNDGCGCRKELDCCSVVLIL